MDQPHRFARALRPGRPPGRGRFAHLALEGLEERCVTAVLAAVDAPEALAGDAAALLSAWESVAPFPWGDGLTDAASTQLPAEPVAPWHPSPPAMERPVWDTEGSGLFGQEAGEGQGPAAPPPVQEPAPEPATPAAAQGKGQPAANALDRGALPRLSVAPVAAAVAFRVSREPAGDARVEVRYTLTAHGRAGAVSAERVAVVPAGAAHVDVPADAAPPAAGREIVTLTLQEGGGYQVARPAGALFLAGDARACSEAALLSAYHEGRSEEALTALVERNRPAVLRACHRVLGNWHDAEDVSQMVFLALAQGQVRLHSTLAGWLGTVARHAAIVALRARNRRYRHEHRASRPAAAPPEDPSAELREELEAALAWLSAPLRDAVRLRYLEGWSQLDAARILGCPRGTLAQRAALGVRRLGEILADRDNLQG
jgi:RNA polymerase sigma factor (sigma-70 family)